MRAPLLVLLAVLAAVQAKIYYLELFDDADWQDRWFTPREWIHNKKQGTWNWVSSMSYGAAQTDNYAIKTGGDNRQFIMASQPWPEPFSNKDKDLVISFTVRHEGKLECSGFYIKILGTDYDPEEFQSDTPYEIMFGPDICGASSLEKRTHTIFRYPPKWDYIKSNERIKCEVDSFSHTYILHIRHEDDSYSVYIDKREIKSGFLKDDYDFNIPEKIPDPAVPKPEDWVEEEMIDDPDDVKPAEWDDEPRTKPDPDAVKPPQWDDEEDGPWIPPEIKNPLYRGTFKPRKIKNPEYKGEWEPPMIPNDNYTIDSRLHWRCNPCGGIAFDLWQVKAGTSFDNIIVADNIDEVLDFTDPAIEARENEKRAKAEAEEIRREQKRREREERRRRKKEQEDALKAVEDFGGDEL